MPKKSKSSKSKHAKEANSQLFAMGELDLIFKIDFKKDDLKIEPSSSSNEDSSESKSEYYTFEDINELKDLSFLEEKEDLWDKFQLRPGNENLKILLMGNKNTKKKCQIDYVCFGKPKFEDDDEFFEEIFDHVTSKCGLNVNKTPLDENARYSLKIEMKSGTETKTIILGKTEEEEQKEKEEQ
jgi:hypothetical protein